MITPAVVDYYGQCVDGLIEYLRLMTPWIMYEWQVTRNDAKIAKGADYFIFFRPGNFNIIGPTPASANAMVKDYDWQAIADIYSRYTEYETSWQKFEAFRAAIIFYININPSLAMYKQSTSTSFLPVPGLFGVNVEANGEALPFESTKNLGAFIVQPLRFTMRQRVKFPLYVKRS